MQKFNPIAIVGQSCILPKASNPQQLWHLIEQGQNAISTVPENLWQVAKEKVFASHIPNHDFTRCDTGGYISDFDKLFKATDYPGLQHPEHLDEIFLWTLHTARAALVDANLLGHDGLKNTGLIMGNLSYPTLSLAQMGEQTYWGNNTLDARNRFMSGYPAHLSAQILGLGAGAFALDAACASSLYAIKLACDKLHFAQADVMLAGGISHADDLFLHIGFDTLQAISKTGLSQPFSAHADGLLPAHGAGFIVLKRLSDALRDNDTIHAVIRAIGLSNDGRGKGFLAPSKDSQVQAMNAAYASCDVQPKEISLVECHATGTPIGDAIEIASMSEVFADNQNMPIGSLKSNMGHLITASGIAGVLKVMAAMKHNIRPPSINAEDTSDALKNSPFRVLQKAEEWQCEGLKRAAINNFGFGGNNAHLIIEEWQNQEFTETIQYHKKEIAVVAMSVIAGNDDTHKFKQAHILGQQNRVSKTDHIHISTQALRFPPNDLKHVLPQQLLMLQTCMKLRAEIAQLDKQKTSILIGMQTDAEVSKYGTRWRLSQHQKSAQLTSAQSNQLKDHITPILNVAGVLGKMPNIVANRLNSQFDIQGPSFAVSSEEISGDVALHLALNALSNGEINAAIVGAVDLCAEQIQALAAEKILNKAASGDAAICLIVKRLEDAKRDNDPILAVIPSSQNQVAMSYQATNSYAHSHCASGLLNIGAAILQCQYRLQPSTSQHHYPIPWLTNEQNYAINVNNQALGEQSIKTQLQVPPKPQPWFKQQPILATFCADTLEQLENQLKNNKQSTQGNYRLAIIAEHPEQYQARLSKAQSLLSKARTDKIINTLGQGIYLGQRKITGKMAFVFTGPAGSYQGMGSDLMLAFPQLLTPLTAKFSKLEEAAGWVYADKAIEPDVLQRIWGSALLSQVHAEFTRNVLKLAPQAIIGFCAGEVNSLLAMGAWDDFEGFYHDMKQQQIFSKHLAGDFAAVKKAWGVEQIHWSSWRVFASAKEALTAIGENKKVHLTIISGPEDLIIAGDREGCLKVMQKLGEQRCRELPFNAAIHCPECGQIETLYHDIHQRNTKAPKGVKFYSHANLQAYTPNKDNAAKNMVGQAIGVVNFPAMVEKAWDDGVRIFIEHGPRAGCSRWASQVLSQQSEDYLTLPLDLDAKQPSLMQALDTSARLFCAGVEIELKALQEQLKVAENAEPQEKQITFPAHFPEIHIEQWLKENPVSVSNESEKIMKQPVSQYQAMPVAPHIAPVGIIPDTPIATATTPPVVAEPTPEVGTDLQSWWVQYQAQLSQVHQQHLQQQSQVHQQFLNLRQTTEQQLFKVAINTPTEVISPPIAATPITPLPVKLPQITQPVSSEPAKPVVLKAKTLPAVVQPTGLQLSREQLKIHASGNISEIYGELFKQQAHRKLQCRMPEPPLLLADRVMGLDAEAGSMGKGTIWTETDVKEDSWYLNNGYMPAGIMIESGQADLMLISYLGIDLITEPDRIYRLLSCELTYYDNLPSPGETLQYDIHVDGHAKQEDIRLFFFHYDCKIKGKTRLKVRQGQAGFFSQQELDDSDGILWKPETQEIVNNPRLDPPEVNCEYRELSEEQVIAFSEGRIWDCFYDAKFLYTKTHVRTPKIQSGKMLFLEKVTTIDPQGGPWKRGYLRVDTEIHPEHWFFDGHFKNDPCMPGTLMFEGCLQAMALYITAMGYTIQRDGWRFQPVPDLAYKLLCRGQVIPTTKHLVYEIFVEELENGPYPTLYADILCTGDGLKGFYARRMGLQLVPDWPITSRPEWLKHYKEKKEVSVAKGFPCDFKALISSAWGKPSDAFGPMYERFDGARKVARLPGPPYHFMTRVTSIKQGDIGDFSAGTEIILEYDIPNDAWYFDENGTRSMPFAVLLEAALQPCGWLASFVGSALTVDDDLSFRNLDGNQSLLVEECFPDSGTFSSHIKITGISANAGMIIENFDVACYLGDKKIYSLQTVFGFFPKAALENQVGLPTTKEQRQYLEEKSEFSVDLTKTANKYCSEALHLAQPMLLMLDRVTGYWPKGGDKGLGRLRAEKDVDPGEWFFKCHFFQDPVQPGSLGLEAMIQLLQFYMLKNNLQKGIKNPRFQAIATGRKFNWKYRGQVISTNKLISTTMDIIACGTDDSGAYAIANASLWVDSKRIYEAQNMTMRIVSGHPSDRIEKINLKKNTWIKDHSPTFTLPALPMMSMLDRLAQAHAGNVIQCKQVKIVKWCLCDKNQILRTQTQAAFTELLNKTDKGWQRLANGEVLTGEYKQAPAAWSPLEGKKANDPYQSGELIHGPAFQILESLISNEQGSSTVLNLDKIHSPIGKLNQILLDASLHGIPHADLQTWSDDISETKVAYPTLIPNMEIFGPTPSTGKIRCEARFDGFFSKPDFPKFKLQLIKDEQVWMQYEIVEACFEKGPIGMAAPLDRRAFLRDKKAVKGLSLSTFEGNQNCLTQAQVDAFDWLPGTVQAIYGSTDIEHIALLESAAKKLNKHPAKINAKQLQTHRQQCKIKHQKKQVCIRY